MRGRVNIEINGEERTLKFDFNALAMLEERLGMSIGKIFAEEQFGVRFLREALFVGLSHEDRKLTPTKVGNMINADNFEYLAEKVSEALANALGGGDEVGEAKESQKED